MLDHHTRTESDLIKARNDVEKRRNRNKNKNKNKNKNRNKKCDFKAYVNDLKVGTVNLLNFLLYQNYMLL